MSKDLSKFRDAAAERTLIGTILRYNKDALMDTQAYLQSKDFSLPINKAIFTCLESLAEDPACGEFDIETVKLKAKSLGLEKYLTGRQEEEYLSLLPECNVSTDNIPIFSLRVKKFSVIRDLYTRYQDAQSYLGNLKGEETLSDIIRNAESTILNFIDGTEGENSLSDLCEQVQEEIQFRIENEVVSQVGITTGFSRYDQAIGGGLRGSAIDVIASRSKVGKGFHAMNCANNIAEMGIPVLYIDTEMSKSVQLNRLISINSGCPIKKYENRSFKDDKVLKNKVIEAGRRLSNIPIKYEAVAGLSHIQTLALARRWLNKTVGFNEKGQANDCVLIYDYIKLTDSASMSNNISETIALGFFMIDLNAFAVKYNVPVLAYAQLNREGIDSDDTSIVACSDRILWNCSSLSSLRNKTVDDEESFGCGFEYGNKKIRILDTRYGAGLNNEVDYINIKASIRPRVNEEEATGLFTEGPLFSEVTGKN